MVGVNGDYISSCMRLKLLEHLRDYFLVPRSFQMVPILSTPPGIGSFLW